MYRLRNPTSTSAFWLSDEARFGHTLGSNSSHSLSWVIASLASGSCIGSDQKNDQQVATPYMPQEQGIDEVGRMKLKVKLADEPQRGGLRAGGAALQRYPTMTCSCSVSDVSECGELSANETPSERLLIERLSNSIVILRVKTAILTYLQ
jgi:hypothetical protein